MSLFDLKVMSLERTIEKKDAEIARLRDALKKYGKHLPTGGCYLSHDGPLCFCGLQEALTPPPKEEEPI